MLDITIKEVNQLVASGSNECEYFGCSVALSSDGLVAIVGAAGSNTKADAAGKVYTYSRNSISDNWVEVNQLVASDSKAYDHFGRSVALSSDGLVAIVGATGSDSIATNGGKVYTYSRTTINDIWKEVNQLLASDGEEFDFFGSSVALSSNGLVAIIGAFYNNTKATDTGKVYTYSRDSINDNWVEVNQLTASDGMKYDHFGSSVALSGDGLVAIVGAYHNDTKALYGGKVYTYSRDTISGNWVEVSKLTASDGKDNEQFGSSVVLSSDGLVAMVGAFGSSDKAHRAGKVYTYSRDSIDDDWKEVNQLVSSDGKDFDYFGSSVALSSNGLVSMIGASHNNTKAKDAGKVYTYTINTNSK